MSFTLMRYKNGKPAPITMSIWDAFKGTPPPKPPKPKPVSVEQSVVQQATIEQPVVVCDPSLQGSGVTAIQVNVPVKCPCCNKVHSAGKPKTKNEVIKDSKNDDSEDKQNQKGGKDNNKSNSKDGTHEGKQGQIFSTKDQETYTEADDKKIITMKQQNKDWSEIMQAIGKASKSQLKEHWKTIDPAKNAESSDKSAQKDGANNKNEAKDKQKDGQGKKDGSQDASKKNNTGKTEEGELKSWSDRYDRQKWIAAASRHFDLTGQRITPAMAKKIAEGK